MMKVLCYDDSDFKHFFVFNILDAYYDPDISGLVLSPANSDMDDFCFPDMDFDCCNGIIFDLFKYGFCDLRNYGELQLYSDVLMEVEQYARF